MTQYGNDHIPYGDVAVKGKSVKREDVDFLSEGVILRAWLYLPEGAGPFPAIALGHGFTGIKDGFLHHDYPGFFAAAGFAALAFDYPNSGESAGDLRGELDPIAQQRAYRDAITYLIDRPEVDEERIGIWGTSYGGGHVLTVGAIDRRVRCVVSQVPTISGSRNHVRRHTPAQLREKRLAFDTDRLARARGGSPAMIQALADDNMFTRMPPECSAHLDKCVTLRTMELYAEYEPASIIERVSPTPLLMIIASDDDMTFTEDELEAYGRAREPKNLVMVDGDHRVVYFEEYERTSTAAREWFLTHLGRPTSS
jgi:fermentation-respiration switch protein FrsA (DUF1100 family)